MMQTPDLSGGNIPTINAERWARAERARVATLAERASADGDELARQRYQGSVDALDATLEVMGLARR